MTIGTGDVPVNIETDIEVGSSAVAAQNILSIYDVTDGTYEYLKQTTLDQLRDSFPTDYTGDPEFWYYLTSTTLQFFPELDADRDFIFSFQKKLTTYASGAVTALLIPDEYVDVLHELVLYKAYRYKTDDRANACLENYNALLDAMIKAESNKSGIIYDQPNSYPERLPIIVDAS